jgi:5-hydroxyisourate hydrolase
MSQITTHILDTTRGLPAQNVPISLYVKKGSDWQLLGGGTTNKDGRLPGLLAEDIKLPAGIYRLNFETSVYFETNSEQGFYPYVDIVFELDDKGAHYHVPLLLTAFGYSTYRGS